MPGLVFDVRVQYHGAAMGFRLSWERGESYRYHAWLDVVAALEAPDKVEPHDGLVYRVIPSPCGELRDGKLAYDRPHTRRAFNLAREEAVSRDLFGEAIRAYHADIAAESVRKRDAKRARAIAGIAPRAVALLARAVEAHTVPADWFEEASALLSGLPR